MSAYTALTNNPKAVEIVYKETFLNLDIRQGGDLETEEFVIDPDGVEDETAVQKYYVIGFLCDLDNVLLTNPVPIYQGMPTRVCVTPNEEARADGIYMRAIDSFYWTRETIYQTAMTPHQRAAPLTDIECVPGVIICAFTTILKAAFFYKLGRVDGAGIGWLQVRTNCFQFLVNYRSISLHCNPVPFLIETVWKWNSRERHQSQAYKDCVVCTPTIL
jgi:hypothetical protein